MSDTYYEVDSAWMFCSKCNLRSSKWGRTYCPYCADGNHENPRKHKRAAFCEPRLRAAYEFDAARIRDALFVSAGDMGAAARALKLSLHYLYARAKLVGVDIPAIRAEIALVKG